MKAALWTDYGPPEVLKIAEVEKPVPADDEILIKIHATTVTAGDCEMRELKFPFYFSVVMRMWLGLLKPKENSIMGTELAGEIEAVGKDVKLFNIGDQVYGAAGMNPGFQAVIRDLFRNQAQGIGHAHHVFDEGLPLQSVFQVFERKRFPQIKATAFRSRQ